MKQLDLSKTKVTGAGLTGFHAPLLEQLVLRCCNNLTYSGLMDLLANNTDHLYELDLFACEKIAVISPASGGASPVMFTYMSFHFKIWVICIIGSSFTTTMRN